MIPTTTLLLSAMLAAVLLEGVAPTPPDTLPAFSDPTHITNPLAPFVPGSVRVFGGRADGERTTNVVTHREQTRDFLLDGVTVPCCIQEEQDFESGALVELSLTYLAQDDEGNVRLFGEISWIIEDGVVTGAEQDSWLVGGATQAGDPPQVYAADGPAMFMPADPQVGDSFDQENQPGSSELLVVVATDKTVKVPAGKFTQALLLMELDDGEDGQAPGPPELRWVVPGVGLVKEKAKGARSELVATALQPVAEPADKP